jgi:hypothetical protein
MPPFIDFGLLLLLLLLLILSTVIEQSFSFDCSPIRMNNSPTSVLMMMNDNDNENSSNNDDDDKQHLNLLSTRSLILNVGILTGRLCGVANTHLPQDTRKNMQPSPSNEAVVVSAISDLFSGLMQTARSVDISLPQAISKKLTLNNKKYPVELCKVSTCSGVEWSGVEWSG